MPGSWMEELQALGELKALEALEQAEDWAESGKAQGSALALVSAIWGLDWEDASKPVKVLALVQVELDEE